MGKECCSGQAVLAGRAQCNGGSIYGKEEGHGESVLMGREQMSGKG